MGYQECVSLWLCAHTVYSDFYFLIVWNLWLLVELVCPQVFSKGRRIKNFELDDGDGGGKLYLKV